MAGNSVSEDHHPLRSCSNNLELLFRISESLKSCIKQTCLLWVKGLKPQPCTVLQRRQRVKTVNWGIAARLRFKQSSFLLHSHWCDRRNCETLLVLCVTEANMHLTKQQLADFLFEICLDLRSFSTKTKVQYPLPHFSLRATWFVMMNSAVQVTDRLAFEARWQSLYMYVT